MEQSSNHRNVVFTLGDMFFEFDEAKNQINIQKHGIPFTVAARIFFDYDRIEMTDIGHSNDELRYNTIGDTSAGNPIRYAAGRFNESIGRINDILFVVYTERVVTLSDGTEHEVTRLISARLATSFERGLYYGKY